MTINKSTLVVCGNAVNLIETLPPNSVHSVITDSPYFLKFMGNGWLHEDLKTTGRSRTSLPGGMAFSSEQGPLLQKFTCEIGKLIMPKLKPGGFYLSFSQARLAPFMGVGLAEAGYELRDMLAWSYNADAEAMAPKEAWIAATVKRKVMDAETEAEFRAGLGSRKIAQLKSQIEPILLAQKPKEGSCTDNWYEHRTGLVDVSRVDGEFPGQLFHCAKPGAAEKARGGIHRTPKPEALMKRLIEVFTSEGDMILDPFMGSGTTGVAAMDMGRSFVGFELDAKVFATAQKRIKKAKGSGGSSGRIVQIGSRSHKFKPNQPRWFEPRPCHPSFVDKRWAA